MGRRPFAAVSLAAVALASAAAPAFATETGGAAVPSTVSNADGSSVPATGGAGALDARVIEIRRERERAEQERAERRRKRERARRRAEERKRQKARHAWVFPVRGWHSFGGSGSRFGADRGDHSHQGQDVTAAEGTPLASVHSGTVRFVDYQSGGAGYYVVIHDSGGKYEFAYMHLKRGSVRVKPGQRVRAGQRIGRVGHTGAASGPHLHFEMWIGPWQTGGHPIDPLEYLKRWDR
jgi:murein DD-endopeptidase MepM/ murein hydrolase activator NlpD